MESRSSADAERLRKKGCEQIQANRIRQATTGLDGRRLETSRSWTGRSAPGGEGTSRWQLNDGFGPDSVLHKTGPVGERPLIQMRSRHSRCR
jgi:hypothetical protein